ncbi:hypothetical protein [Roseateles flavus]|uniref:Uncharacterized protein n=1 Tax=Roseateles flavus TaxID=3149041 RepID=A0ABV0GG25_9BURK
MREDKAAPSIEATNVGQLVAGGTVRSIDRSIKITNIWSEKPTPMLTALQRKAVADKVGQTCEATGLSRLDVYKVVLAECGFERMDDVPRQQFGEVMGLLDGLTRQAAGEDAPAPAPSRWPPFANRWTVSLVFSGAAIVTSLGTASRPVAADQPATCSLGGRQYSVGSVVVMADRFVRECVEVTEEGHWREVPSTP